MPRRSDYPEEAASYLFAASRTKMIRARQFIAELEADLQDYRDNEPVVVSFGEEPEPGENQQLSISWKAITLRPGAILGDAIHNLRTALDLMASELARKNGQTDKDVYFPFGADALDLDEAIKKRRFDKAGQDAVALLKTFEPFRGGRDHLRVLHDLDIQDKHTALVAHGANIKMQIVSGFTIEDPTPRNTLVVNPMEIHYVFPDTSAVLAGARIVESLKGLADTVDRILEAFTALVASRK